MTVTSTLAPLAEQSSASGKGGSTRRKIIEFVRRPVAFVAAIFLLAVIIAVILAPLLAPFDPLAQDLTHTLSGPTPLHPLGTDQLGRDVLSRLLWGGRTTLLGVAEALVVAFVVGLVVGLIAGFVGGITDSVTSRIVEIVMAIPGIVVLLMVYSLTNNDPNAGMFALGLLSVPTILRVTRGAARTVRSETFISASEVVGMSKARILRRHVLPNIWGPIIVNTAVLAAVNLGVQGGLNYLNLGVVPPAPSWGGMVAEAQTNLQLQPWLIFPSGLTIALTIAAFILIADGLRDVTTASRSRPSVRTRSRDTDPAPLPASEPQLLRQGILQVRDLAVRFGTLEVVRGVTVSVARGETLGIVGESGCGKSVTASAILNSLGRGATITGTILFDGRDLNSVSRRERAGVRGSGIAYISQDPMVSLDPSFSVASQLGELIRTHDRSDKRTTRARVLDLLAQVGLPDPEAVAGRYPHELSGGMAQRVSIACALAGRPRVLIADEPTTALDVTIQGEILSLLRRLRDDQGMAIVLITHDLGVVADLCDRVAVMYAGEVVETGSVEELFANPAHPYTRALIDANPIMAQRALPLRAIPGVVPSPADWPRGCHFFERCPIRTEECAATAIPLITIDQADRESRCIHVDELVGARS
jgi:peptide/nickel transport system permease protein